MLLGFDAKLVVESMMPDLLHRVPVGNDAELDGVLERKHITLGLGFVTDIESLLVLGTTHDGRKDSAGSVVAGKAGLGYKRPIFYNKMLWGVIVSHYDICRQVARLVS